MHIWVHTRCLHMGTHKLFTQDVYAWVHTRCDKNRSVVWFVLYTHASPQDMNIMYNV